MKAKRFPIFLGGRRTLQPVARARRDQADADIIVFGGLGLIFDDYYFFRSRFEDEGIFGRTVMFVNLASDPIVRARADSGFGVEGRGRFAVEERKRVLVLMTDMTAFADALKEIGISMEQVPAIAGTPAISIANWRCAMNGHAATRGRLRSRS